MAPLPNPMYMQWLCIMQSYMPPVLLIEPDCTADTTLPHLLVGESVFPVGRW
jgi:hypothetical protein